MALYREIPIQFLQKASKKKLMPGFTGALASKKEKKRKREAFMGTVKQIIVREHKIKNKKNEL